MMNLERCDLAKRRFVSNFMRRILLKRRKKERKRIKHKDGNVDKVFLFEVGSGMQARLGLWSLLSVADSLIWV